MIDKRLKTLVFVACILGLVIICGYVFIITNIVQINSPIRSPLINETNNESSDTPITPSPPGEYRASPAPTITLTMPMPTIPEAMKDGAFTKEYEEYLRLVSEGKWNASDIPPDPYDYSYLEGRRLNYSRPTGQGGG